VRTRACACLAAAVREEVVVGLQVVVVLALQAIVVLQVADHLALVVLLWDLVERHVPKIQSGGTKGSKS
jgi:hypothetical protein